MTNPVISALKVSCQRFLSEPNAHRRVGPVGKALLRHAELDRTLSTCFVVEAAFPSGLMPIHTAWAYVYDGHLVIADGKTRPIARNKGLRSQSLAARVVYGSAMLSIAPERILTLPAYGWDWQGKQSSFGFKMACLKRSLPDRLQALQTPIYHLSEEGLKDQMRAASQAFLGPFEFRGEQVPVYDQTFLSIAGLRKALAVPEGQVFKPPILRLVTSNWNGGA